MATANSKKGGKGGSTVLRCTCVHKVQDGFYGPQRRVFNRAPGHEASGRKDWRCSVCGAMGSTFE